MKRVLGRGWGAVIALTVFTVILSVFSPAVLIFIPLAVLLLAFPPHRPLGVGLAIVLLFLSMTERDGQLWDVERGWALIVSAWFVFAVVALPGARFLNRALLAVSASATSVGLSLFVAPNTFTTVDTRVASRLRAAAENVATSWGGSGELGSQVAAAVRSAVELQVAVYPALLALATVAGLGVAWWAFRRLASSDADPFVPLREFSFHDGLVWVLIAGLTLVVAPLALFGAEGLSVAPFVERAGTNVLAFMGGLYALRGVAVLLFLAGVPGPFGLLIGGLAALLLYPFVVLTTFLLGLSDTWLHLRSRRAMTGKGAGGEGQ